MTTLSKSKLSYPVIVPRLSFWNQEGYAAWCVVNQCGKELDASRQHAGFAGPGVPITSFATFTRRWRASLDRARLGLSFSAGLAHHPGMKTILPWLCAVALLVGLGVEFANNKKQAADMAQLRADKEELQNRVSVEQAKTTQASAESDELVQLRKDHEDLLRLRNEVRQLRDEKQQLAKQAQTAQATAANPQHQQSQQQVQQLLAENQQLRAQSLSIQASNQINSCIANLRQIETAKQQWAAANGKPAGALVSPQDLAALLPSKAMPTCPAGGVYTLNPIGLNPICNIPGHQIPK
jgi:hypothetical protein